MMHMTFYWGTQATILFDGWKTSTYTNFALSLCALFLSSIVLQYLSHVRISAISSSSGKSSSSDVKVSLLGGTKLSSSLGKRALGSAIFGARVGLGYLLMLAAMSFNGGVFIAIVLGFAVGHFLFADETTSTDAVASSKDTEACGCS